MKKFKFLIPVIMMGSYFGCTATTGGADYQALINEAWIQFDGHTYAPAISKFVEAKNTDSTLSAAYNGIGWSYLEIDGLADAQTFFSQGSTRNPASADLLAGWAFVLNAQKKYSQSNEKIVSALGVEANWNFGHGTGLDKSDLLVLKADNYYSLGDFSNSLAAVLLLDSSFTTDIQTSAGQAALGAEIESLRTSFHKRKLVQ
jgi:hypothetical protein